MALFRSQPEAVCPTMEATAQCLESLRIRNDVPVPESIRDGVVFEQRHNDVSKMHDRYASPTDTSLHPAYRPYESNVFELPFVRVSAEELDTLGVEPGAACRDGELYRFFIHPASVPCGI